MQDHDLPSSHTAHLPTVDLYGPVHKGLRWALCALLNRMGATDFSDPNRVSVVLDDLDGVLYLCDSHLDHEDRHIHTAIERRRPGASATLSREHDEHRQAIAELRALGDALAGASSETLVAHGRALYLKFSQFVSENLAHMVEEETVVQPLLERLYSEQELTALEDALLRSIGPDEMLAFVRVMVPANAVEVGVALLSNVQAAMPDRAFEELLGSFRPQLDERHFAILSSSLGVAA